jgi:hypothetical protein
LGVVIGLCSALTPLPSRIGESQLHEPSKAAVPRENNRGIAPPGSGRGAERISENISIGSNGSRCSVAIDHLIAGDKL